jgi:hypothetical protein
MRTITRRRVATSALLTAALVGLVAAATAIAAPPRETLQPTLDGTFRQGATIRTNNGGWSNNPTSYTYRWLRCDANGQNCANIAGATTQTYRLVQADVGRTVLAVVTARNADGAGSANTKPSPVIADNVVPQNTAPPTVAGTPVVGGTLTASPGTWTGAPTFSFVWLRCDAAGANCGDTGSRGRNYGVRAEDLGRTIRVQVTGRNPRGSTTSTSAQSGLVRSGSAGPGPAVPISSVSLPDRLVITGVTTTPTAIPNRATLVTMRIRVGDTRGRLVSGALVYATAVPFGRVTNMAETTTDANGVATVQFRATARLPIQRNTAVQFFLRARKSGENPLAGVSTRRLVQVRIVPS